MSLVLRNTAKKLLINVRISHESSTKRFLSPSFSVERMNSLYNQTKELAERALKQATDAYDDSLDIYTDADSINLPYVDIDGLKEDASEIKDEVRVAEENRSTSITLTLSPWSGVFAIFLSQTGILV